MKKATQARPNVRLKEARELRGWSQKFVADEIGADRYYLSRWEHGTASPSPYYRQKLCALFGLNARELGLLQEDTPVRAKEAAREEQPAWVTAAAHPGVIYDPAIPPFVVGAKGLVGRDEVLQQIKKRLCSGQGIASSALHGLPGVGKTSLAATLAQDPDVLEHFS
ncbi:MAG TPA: helix-turn-helix domain-containing protein, partial [Ktedonobacteraceae bacterium]|nr:helix-turn-helix domain-containing protein [Ktedonobacteraceae bacterium]